MPSSEYLTIEAPSTATIREKMSRFIAIAIPVSDEDEARREIARIANEYHDARHVCWAYRLGADGATSQSNDNGEPSGTAGRPILGQIRSMELTNVAVAVVRYFGGIKLGTSGLIAAYRTATRAALEEARVIRGYEMDQLSFTFSYPVVNDVMKIVKTPDIKILSQQFDNSCAMTVSVRTDRIDELRRRLAEIDSLTF